MGASRISFAMLTIEQLRSSRNLLFWSLHAAGWAAYGLTRYFGMLFYNQPADHVDIIVITATAGFGLSIPMRYGCRALWGRSALWVVLGVLAASYVTALALRIFVHLAGQRFIDPTQQFSTLFDLFCGALPSTYVLVCWSALYFGIRYYESRKQQQEALLQARALAQKAQLKMLRYQLSPRFLFNTLNTISALILDNQNRRANDALMRLSDFLRHTLDKDPTQRVTLRQEIDALDLYVGVERLRLGERLRLQYTIDRAAFQALVPSLLLQPLLENSLKYASSSQEQAGLVRIESRARGSVLEISVSDEGRGLRERALVAQRSDVGLRNTRERLAVLYGDNHRIAVIDTHPGLRIELSLPFETASGEEIARPEPRAPTLVGNLLVEQ